VTYHAMKLLSQAQRGDAGCEDRGGETAAIRLYVALVGSALCDIHRDRRLRSRGPAPRTLGLDPEQIGRWFCDSSLHADVSASGQEAAGWLLRHLDAILGHYAASDIVFEVAEGDCRDATGDILESLAEQHAVELGRRSEQLRMPMPVNGAGQHRGALHA